MKIETLYSQVPDLLTAYAPEYRNDHYHLHGRNIENWESFKSIFLTEHDTTNMLGKKVIKGGLIGLTYGYIARNFLWRGPKSFEMDRLVLKNNGAPIVKSFRGYAAFGAVMGAAWWVIKDVLCVPHGSDTYNRQLLSYGLMGGVLMATIYHPANFIYGFLAGMFFGGVLMTVTLKNLPKGFELKIQGVDPEKRARLLREDEEYELSQRHVLTTKTNLYPL